jgi:hypothetical protein
MRPARKGKRHAAGDDRAKCPIWSSRTRKVARSSGSGWNPCEMPAADPLARASRGPASAGATAFLSGHPGREERSRGRLSPARGERAPAFFCRPRFFVTLPNGGTAIPARGRVSTGPVVTLPNGGTSIPALGRVSAGPVGTVPREGIAVPGFCVLTLAQGQRSPRKGHCPSRARHSPPAILSLAAAEVHRSPRNVHCPPRGDRRPELLFCDPNAGKTAPAET